MRKNWLAAAWARRFRARPVIPDAAFQGATEPYPGHWRRFPEPWPAAPAGRPGAEVRTPAQQAALDSALARLPELWRRVVTERDVARRDDQQVADDLDLTLDQERDILARARAAVRDRLDRTRADGPG
jgi:RNA polymerase sigma-70 factor (ECF subfamily)